MQQFAHPDSDVRQALALALHVPLAVAPHQRLERPRQRRPAGWQSWAHMAHSGSVACWLQRGGRQHQ